MLLLDNYKLISVGLGLGLFFSFTLSFLCPSVCLSILPVPPTFLPLALCPLLFHYPCQLLEGPIASTVTPLQLQAWKPRLSPPLLLLKPSTAPLSPPPPHPLIHSSILPLLLKRHYQVLHNSELVSHWQSNSWFRIFYNSLWQWCNVGFTDW